MLVASQILGTHRSRVVGRTAEFRRIADLPRRTSWADLSWALTLWLRIPGGTRVLRPWQAWALTEVMEFGGLMGFGAVGCGKCVTGDTEVFDGARRRTVAEVAADASPFSVLTLDEVRRIRLAPARVWPSGTKSCLRVRLADGAACTLSADHPVLTPEGWVPAGQLLVGSLVATPRTVAVAKPVREVGADEVVLAAYLLSDGGVSQSYTGFSNQTAAVVEEFARVALRLGVPQHSWKHKPLRVWTRDGLNYRVRGLTAFRDKWGLHGLAKAKRVPAEFWALPRHLVGLFLNRFWACDGYVMPQGFGITLASERMVDDLKFLLLRLGVRASKRHRMAKCNGKCFDAWCLAFSGRDALVFLLRAGPILGKEVACRRLYEKLISVARNTNYDVVPVGPKEVASICDELGFPVGSRWKPTRRTSVAQFLHSTRGQYVSRVKFARFCAKYNYEGEKAWLAHTDIVWERVKGLEDVGPQPVYDVSVPSTGCFVGNGVVLHNTDVAHLAPVALGLERPVLLVPAALREKAYAHDIPLLSKHWRMHPRLTIVSYEQLSRVKQADLLDTIQPDGIIADEAHRLKNFRTAGVARRVARYLEAHADCVYVDLSGSPDKRSIKDYAHRVTWALGTSAPLPTRYSEIEAWAGALDPKVAEHLRVDPGALHLLCEPGERPVEGFRRRLLETPGVVMSPDPGVSASLHVLERHVEVPQTVRDAFESLRMGVTPAGEVIVNGLELARHAREVAVGVVYYWEWPDTTSNELRQDWLGARKAWRQYVRQVVKHSGRSSVHAYDTEMQVAQACVSGALVPPEGQYARWLAVRDRTHPTTTVRWIHEYMVDEILAYLATTERALVWVDLTALQEKLRERGALVYGAGENGVSDETRNAVVSLASHGTGKNLHHYWNNLFVAVSGGGDVWEQAIGRTHRPGTEADEVTCEVVLPCIEMWNAFAQARRDAAWYEESRGMRQKLSYADVVVTPEDEVIRRARARPLDPLWCADWPEAQ